MHSSRYPRFLPALVVGYLVMLLTACDAGVSNSKIISPSPSPVATTVPVPPTRTDCPGSGTARAAVMPDLTLGSDTNIVYSISGYQANGQATSVMLKHYDVVTGNKTEIMKLASTSISEAEVSADGQWVLFLAQVASQMEIQMVRMDGKDLQTLYCAPSNQIISDIHWSADQKSLVFIVGPATDPFTLYLLNVTKGKLQQELVPTGSSSGYKPLAWLDNTHVYLSNISHLSTTAEKLYLLDTKNGVHQSERKLQLVFNPPNSQVCWDFASSFDGSQVFTSECNAFYPNGPDSYVQKGPSRISVRPATGGASHTIFTSPKLALTDIVAINQSSLLLVVQNSSTDGSVNMSQNGVWKINMDGTGLTRLTTDSKQNEVSLLGTQTHWGSISRDGSMYSVTEAGGGLGQPPTFSLLFGSLSGGKPTTFAAASDGTQLMIVGWTTM